MPHHKFLSTLVFIKSTKADPQAIPSRKPFLEKHTVPILTALLIEQSNFEHPAKACECVVNYLRNSPKQIVEIAKEIITEGLTDDAKMIFQAGNLMTELLTTILFRYAYHTITPIIKTTLKQLMKISNLSDLNLQIEVDEPEHVLNKVEKLAKLVKHFFASLSNVKWSIEVLHMLKFTYDKMESKYNMGNYTISYFLFVPFICQVVKNAHYYNLLSKQKFDAHQNSLQLFCDLVLNVVHNIEFKDSQSYLSCLNCIIRRHSSHWTNIVKEFLALAESKLEAATSKKNENSKLHFDKEYLPMVELYLSIYELPIFSRLKHKNDELFFEFLATCKVENQEKIANFPFPNPASANEVFDLKFLEIIYEYFNINSNEFQYHSKVKQVPVLKHRIHIINKIAALEGQIVRKNGIDVILLSLNDEGRVSFPFYEEKLKLIIDLLQNETLDPSSDNAFAILLKLYEFKVNPNSYNIRSRASLPSLIYQTDNAQSSSDDLNAYKAFEFNSFENLLGLLCDWGLDCLIAQELVPNIIRDRNSLLNFDVSLLKDLKVSLGVRKTFQRKLNEMKTALEKDHEALFEMNNDNVCDWLEDIGFGMYIPIFKQAHITGKDLQSFSVATLKGLGIPLLGHRKTIMREITRAAHPCSSISDSMLARRNSNPMLGASNQEPRLLKKKQILVHDVRRRGSSPHLAQ